jgi:hypothetical protein
MSENSQACYEQKKAPCVSNANTWMKIVGSENRLVLCIICMDIAIVTNGCCHVVTCHTGLFGKGRDRVTRIHPSHVQNSLSTDSNRHI